MSKLPRIIVPGVAHHVAQRGNRRQREFWVDDDYSLYKDWLAKSYHQSGVEVWSYCLMHNHVHLILVPADDTGLSRAIGEISSAGSFPQRGDESGEDEMGRPSVGLGMIEYVGTPE
jgi:REP element-mobilizing transposase RayT